MNNNLDYILLYNAADIIEKIVSVALGFVVVFIVVYMFIITAVDIVYIAIPVLRGANFRDRKYFGLRLVSKDAKGAVIESFKTDEPALKIYARKRAKTYIISAFVVYFMTTGGYTLRNIVTNILIKIFLGIGILN